MHAPRIRTLVGGIGVAVALATAFAPPLGYFTQGYVHAAEALASGSRFNAHRLARHVHLDEPAWRLPPGAILELVEAPDDGATGVRYRVVDASGRVMAESGGALAAPVARTRQPITVRGESVAWLEAETSLRPLLAGTAGIAALSFALGLVAWIAARVLPLRVLDRTLARLSAEGARLKARSARLEAALDVVARGLCLFDMQGRLVMHNQRFAAMFGTPPADATASSLGAATRLGDALSPPGPDWSEDWREGPDGQAHELPDGRVIQVSRQAMPGQGWAATFEDVTERRRVRDQLSHMARHDALTGLPNRVCFREHMEHLLRRSGQAGGVAVLYLDLDGFKGVNDTLGHPVGDELLRAVATRLRDCTRETDLVARLGGDEFAIVQADAVQPVEATTLSDRLIQALREPFNLQGHHVVVGVSVGVALAGEADTADGLLRNADIALYRAKAAGRGTWRVFEPQMDAEMQARRVLEADLRQALPGGQFEVFYQPLVNASTNALTGFEALLRWNHPGRRVVPPAEFIPLAEETGLIRGIDAWVLERACAAAAGWPEHVKIAVNLSAVQFARGDLVREVEQALAASGLAPNRLELEITEAVLQEGDVNLDTLHRLRDLGVRIAMDGFGAGCSSLSNLRRFPFDKIKIDRSLAHALAVESGSVEAIRAVVGLGQALSMDVLAEGVETAEQLRVLQAEGCDELQGYLFSTPRPPRELQDIIERYAPVPDPERQATGRRSAPHLTLVHDKP